MNDEEQLELDIPEEPLTEEGLEEDIKRNEERRQKEYDEATKGNEEIRKARSRRGRGGETQLDIPGLFEARSGLRTTAALGTEIFLNTLVDPLFEPGTQIAAGTLINALAQRIRGGEISKGELAASGLASLIPGGAQGRAITQFAKGAGKGALSGAIETAGMAGIDEGRLPTKEELAAGLGIGAAFGGIVSTPQATKVLQDVRARIKGQYTPITAYAAKPATGVGPSYVDPDGQGQLFSPAQQARLTVNRPPGMTLAAFNALRDGGMLVDVMPISNAADISEFSRGFVSALTNPNFGIGNFVTARNAAIADFGEKYYQLTRSIARPNFLAPELDHTTPLKVTGHILFPGSTRKQIKEYVDILYDNGLYAGDDPANLRLLPGEVHQVATNWVTTNLGRHGQFFLQKVSLLNLPRTKAGNYTHDAKKQIAGLYAKEVKKLKDKVAEAYEHFDDLYAMQTPGIGGLSDESIDKFTEIMSFIDLDSPTTLQSIKDIAEGAAQGTPYMFSQLQETIDMILETRKKAREALDNLFRLERTNADPRRIQAANAAANRFMNEADDLQSTFNNLLKAEIED
jgi:hypothetical protein